MWTREWLAAQLLAQTLTAARGEQLVSDNRATGGTVIGTHFAKAVC